jgi:beta-galactosidase
MGTSTGYTTPHSYEAQADYFEKIIDYSENIYHAGYFLSTMFDYRTDYNSIISGYSNEKLVFLGILDENRKTNRLAYKVIYTRLHNLEKVTIPMGIKKDDAPMVFIIFGLVLALFMGFLVNSGRKFREDATRALLRPYNFFADIRDLRIISGVQTTLLALIIAAVWGLIKGSFLYSHKTNLFLEKVLLSFGTDWIINSVSYLTWHPTEALFWLSGFFLVALLIITLLIKIFSFFVINKVFFSNAYFTTVWALLPSVLLVPLAIVLYRLLEADVITVYLYIFLIVVALWIFYRLLKGIFVIYDVSAGKVYFYSFVFILAVVGGLILYFQLNEQTVDFIIQSFNERF